MNIGDILHTSAEREAAPIGAVITLVSGANVPRWTKTDTDQWTSHGAVRSNHTGGWSADGHGGGYHVVEFPASTRLQVGEQVVLPEQFITLPVGTMVHRTHASGDTAYHRVKNADGAWVTNDGASPIGRLRADGFFTVASLPEETQPTEEVPADEPGYSELLAQPVGARFHLADSPTVRWVVNDGFLAVRESDQYGVNVPLDVFEGPADAGQLRMVGDTPEPEVALEVERMVRLVVGDMVTTREELSSLPLGTVITRDSGVERTRFEGGWRRVEGVTVSTERLSLTPQWTITALPTVALPAVGEGVQTLEQFLAMPLGSVVTTGRDRWAKVEGGWHMAGGGTLRDDQMTVGGHNTVVSYPEAEVVLPEVGAFVTSIDQFIALPEGSVVTWSSGAHRVTKVGGEWRHEDGDQHWPSEAMNTGDLWVLASSDQVFTIGMDITTVEQYAALPVHSVVRRNPTEDSHCPVVKAGSNRWQDQTNRWTDDAMSTDARTLVALPQGSVTASQPVDTVTVAEAEAERNRAVADARISAVAERDEEFLCVLREHWDGVNFHEDEINRVLGALGLEPITNTEQVTVTVEVEGETTLDNGSVESMVEGGLNARLDEVVVVRWTIEGLEFGNIEVTTGSCACDFITQGAVRSRLSDRGVSFDSFTFEPSCPNC